MSAKVELRSYPLVVDLPATLIDRIVESIESQMPAGFTLQRSSPRTLRFHVSPMAASRADSLKPQFGMSQIGVRNRDGITPQSIAWAVWLVLDSLINMSKSGGLPWPSDIAATLRAYAESGDDGIRSWVASKAGFRVEFPSIPLDGVQMAAPSGLRLPMPLAKKYRLPSDGPVTSPGNDG
jgi:hypothetical protein